MSVSSLQILLDGQPSGGGILIAHRYVVTLQHVVADEQQGQRQHISFCLPQSTQQIFHGEFCQSYLLVCPGVIGQDSLVLYSVLEAPEQLPQLNDGHQLRKPLSDDIQLKIKGFPKNSDAGEWLSLSIDGGINPVCTQVSWAADANGIHPGFSGCPVITTNESFVIGLLGWDRHQLRLAYFVNAEQILLAFPELKPLIEPIHVQRRMINQSKNYARLSCEIQLVTALGPQTISINDGLYIEREIETQLYQHILNQYQQNNACLTVLKGDAGLGKTSLLARLYSQLVQQLGEQYVWLIRASLLKGEPNVPGEFHYQMLSALKRSLCKVVILIDTVDLLLQSDTQALATVEKLIALMEAGATVVCSSRVQEFENQLAVVYQDLASQQPKAYKLNAYSNSELPKAIASHISCFYRAFDHAVTEEQSVDAHIEKIRSVMHQGTPLSEICRNPLTLRMLFSVYAPQEVNHHEVNTFKLYEDFWSFRVVGDKRVFSGKTEENGRDASDFVRRIALTMLSMGTTEIDENTLSRWDNEQLEMLVNRGVLVYSSPTVVSFFHQTFFEHAAARGLVNLSGGVGAITKKIIDQPNNLYLLPVFEQAVLLGVNLPGQEYLDASQAIQSTVQSKALTLISACSYIYVHSTAAQNRQLKTIIDNIILPGSESVQCSFLTLLANVPGHRLSEAYGVLSQLWQMHNWRIQENICELILKLSVREVRLFADFFYDNDIIGVLDGVKLEKSLSAKRLSILADCYCALIEHDSLMAFKGLLHCFERIRLLVTGAHLLGKILQIIEQNLLRFGLEVVENAIVPLMLDYEYPDNFRIKGFEYQTGAGHLMYCLWQAKGCSMVDFYQRFSHIEHKVAQLIVFNALDHFILNEPDSQLNELFSLISAEAAVNKRFLLYSIPLSKVAGCVYQDTELSEKHGVKLLDFVTGQFCTQELTTQKQVVAFISFLSFEQQALFHGCFNALSIEQWQTHESLFKMAVVASVNGCEQVQQVINQLRFQQPWNKSLSSQFRQHGASDARVLAMLLRTMGSDIGLLTSCYRVLTESQLNFDYRGVLSQHQDFLSESVLVKTDMSVELLECKLNLLSFFMPINTLNLPLADPVFLMARYNKVKSVPLKAAIARYWLSHGKHRAPLLDHRDLQQLLVQPQNSKIGLILIELAGYSHGTSADFCTTMELILNDCITVQPNVTIEVVSAMRALFEVTLEQFGSDIAVKYFIQFVLLYERKFGIKQKKNATHKLLTISSKICVALDSEQLQAFIEVARQVDRFTGRVLVDAACKTRLRDSKDIILPFIHDAVLADELKEMIRKYAHHHHRSEWSADWVELHQLIAQMPK